ncbi:MAG: hypothetical protein JOY62_06900 [Acidobacteriaceae bacterium]|nr:hypothetical protein [Acidobacteriaceae bacterium]
MLLAVFASQIDAQREIYGHKGDDAFDLKISEVRALPRARERVGFSRVPTTYAVTASGSDSIYTLYCFGRAPEAGRTYPALDVYVSDDWSPLRLWPIEKRDLRLPEGVKKKGGAVPGGDYPEHADHGAS